MAKLNFEIFEEVFKQLMKSFISEIDTYYTQNFIENSLAKFMLLGKKQFDMVLKHFSQVDVVDITDENIKFAYTDKHRFHHNYYYFNYNFPLLKPILLSIHPSLDRLSISALPAIAQERKVFDHVIGGEILKTLNIDTDIPHDYYGLLKASKTIEAIFIIKQFFLFDFSMIPPSCNYLEITAKHLKPIFKNQNLNFSLPGIKSLYIQGFFLQTDFTMDKLENISSLGIKYFPMLQYLYISIEIVSEWSQIKDMVFAIKESTFEKIPPNISGEIVIFSKCHNYEQALEDIADKSDINFYGIHEGVKKTFLIQNNLKFEYSLFSNVMTNYKLEDAVISEESDSE